MKKKIAIIGAGNIGLAIAEGVTKSGIAEKVFITRKNKGFSEILNQDYECLGNKDAVLNADIIILAVQPTQIDELLQEIKNYVKKGQLIISVVSGISIERIEKLIEISGIHVARAMPNTGIRYGQSMTCLSFNEQSLKLKEIVQSIFGSLGKTLIIPESNFPEATVLCGSGIALVLRFIRAYMQAGIQSGFNEHDALLIATQVMIGAASLCEKGSHPEMEIDKVTTPRGITIETLIEMERAGFSSALNSGIKVGVSKAKSLYE